MRISVMATLVIAMGLAGDYRPSMAQSTGKTEDTLRQVLSALAANDQPALSKLSIDQGDFKKYVWPTMAAQFTGSNMSADKYFTTYQKVSQAGITETRTDLAGKKWEVVKVSLDPPQRKGKGFQLFSPPQITLRDESGQEKTMKVVGGLLEKDGVYKVTTYYLSPSQKGPKQVERTASK